LKNKLHRVSSTVILVKSEEKAKGRKIYEPETYCAPSGFSLFKYLLCIRVTMAQGVERRLRCIERSAKKSVPMPWLKHKLYLMGIYTGTYVMDTWESVLVLSIVGFLVYWIASSNFAVKLD